MHAAGLSKQMSIYNLDTKMWGVPTIFTFDNQPSARAGAGPRPPPFLRAAAILAVSTMAAR